MVGFEKKWIENSTKEEDKSKFDLRKRPKMCVNQLKFVKINLDFWKPVKVTKPSKWSEVVITYNFLISFSLKMDPKKLISISVKKIKKNKLIQINFH